MDLFGTAGIRGSAEDRVTPELALAVGRAVAIEARDDDQGAIESDGDVDPAPEFVLARDGRVTGPTIAAAMEAGLASGGAKVRRAGQLPTPGLAHASQGRHGVMLTASHNPPPDNGIKLFRDGVEFDRDAERAVERRVADGEPPASWDAWTTTERIAPLDAYLDAVVGYARSFGDDASSGLDGLRIAVDCGNGMAGPATPTVLRELGAMVVTLNGNVDGHFPGRGSKPTPETLEDLRAFITAANDGVTEPGRPTPDGDAEGFAFGIGHDGDADRVVLVDASGEVVHEDTVLAILAERYVRRSEADEPVVVTTPNASGRIDERVRAAGGRVERVRLGALHEGIAAAEADGDAVAFAAEPWKHVHVPFGGWIDGVCSAAVLARLIGSEGLSSLRDPVTERPYQKVSVDCPDDRKSAVMDDLRGRLPDAFPDADMNTDHGVRLEFPDASWALVRPSGTEPYVRVYAESDDVDELIEAVASIVSTAVDDA
ncbi:MAG: phosphomannomutase [Halorubrum sp.]